MRPGRLVVLALLLAPLAAAEASARVEGALHFPRGVTFAGPVEVVAPGGGLDLAPDVARGHPFRLTWESAEGRHVRGWKDYYGASGFVVQASDDQSSVEPLGFGAATLTGVSCQGECGVLLVDGGAPALVGAAAGPAGWLAEERTYRGGELPEDPGYYVRPFPEGTLVASGGFEGAMPVRDAVPRAEGDFTLFLWGATVVVQDGRGAHEIATGDLGVTAPTVAGAAVPGERRESAHVVLRLRGAHLESAPGSSAILLGESMAWRLDGSLSAPEAEGTLHVGGRRVEAQGPLQVRGLLEVSAGVRDARGPALLARPDGLDATLRGEASEVVVGGRVVEAPLALGSPARVALLPVAAMAAALALRHAAGLPLYTRLERTSVLRNANRRAVHAAIVAQPGAILADLVRATGLVEVVVRHHVRMLERHGLVAVRRAGRLRACYPAGAAAEPQAAAAQAALRDPTRARVALALAAAEALTQRELGEATGLTQRVVSYHLALLARDGLVDDDGRMPKRYRAAAPLRERLAGPGP